MQQADLPQGYARQLDGNGGVQTAGVWRLLMDQVDLMDLMDKMGAPRDNPWVGGTAVEWGAWGSFTARRCRQRRPATWLFLPSFFYLKKKRGGGEG